jgi:bifunctional UDP-N-acetylglucosamine pyrophosphorylase/glucosamine-1-phosphate N-acetyltransferase
MQTVVLAAGRGSRMEPLTTTTPKPMLPVAGRPLVEHTARGAVAAGASSLVFVVGYRGDTVREHFGASYDGVPISYAEQDQQHGTADALSAASDHLDGPFVVLNGDDLYDPTSLAGLYGDSPAVGGYSVEDPTAYGVLSVDAGEVIDITEKPADPPSNVVNTGAYRFPAVAAEWAATVDRSPRGEQEITDLLARVIKEFDVGLVPVERWLGVGRPWELLAANEWQLGSIERQIAGEVAPDAELRGDVVLEAGATVDSGVVVEGPALIRSGASVGPNALIRGATLLEEDVHVGHGVEVKNSVLMAGTNIPHLSYCGDSVLGPDVNLGAGTQLANLRHDEADVRMTVEGTTVSTGRRKMGLVAGAGVRTGVNVSIDPGVVLSDGAEIAPGTRVSADR